MNAHDEWLAKRQQGITGTDVSVLLGWNPWKREDELLASKLGMGTPFTGNAATRTGVLLESHVANLWARDKQKILTSGQFTVSEENHLFIGTPDFLFPDGILEIKTGAESSYKRGLPKYYRAQVQWYMMITGRHEAELSALIVPKDRTECPQEGDDPDYIWEWCLNRPRRDFEVLEDLDLQSRMKELAVRFWERLQSIREQKYQVKRSVLD